MLAALLMSSKRTTMTMTHVDVNEGSLTSTRSFGVFLLLSKLLCAWLISKNKKTESIKVVTGSIDANGCVRVCSRRRDMSGKRV